MSLVWSTVPTIGIRVKLRDPFVNMLYLSALEIGCISIKRYTKVMFTY